MVRGHVATYLNDHLAGGAAALELIDHLERARADTPAAAFAAELRAEILADRGVLEGLMGRLGVTTSAPGKAAAWLAEKATELKLKADDPSAGSFRVLEILDGLSVGIEGKRLLWRALSAVSEAIPELRGPDYPHLERRPEEQRDRVEAVRLDAARAALGTDDQK